MQKPPSIDLKFDHAAPALLDELFKLDVVMTSSETEPVEATLCAEIKYSEGAGSIYKRMIKPLHPVINLIC